jgi:hypothetical protein
MIGVCSTRPVKYVSGATIVGTLPHAMIFILDILERVGRTKGRARPISCGSFASQGGRCNPALSCCRAAASIRARASNGTPYQGV